MRQSWTRERVRTYAESAQHKANQLCELANPPSFISRQAHYLQGHSVTKWGYEYDSQRKKLYAAERQVDWGEPLENLEAVQEYVDRLVQYRWFERRWGTRRKIRVSGGLRTYDGRAWKHEGRIQIRNRTEHVILHEVAHILVPKPHGSHGRLFARTQLELVKYARGKEHYEALLERFRDLGVKYQPKRSLPWES